MTRTSSAGSSSISRSRPGRPKERFGYLFPNRDAAQIIVRLRPDLTDSERHQAIELFREAVSNPRFKLSDGSYVVTGAPVVVDAGARELRSQTLLLLGVAGLVMALTLLLILPRPLRLLPLAVAVAAGSMTLGLVALFGGSLTVGAIAMLPGAGRAGGGLRDPVPGPLQRGAGRGGAARPGRRSRRRGGRDR